MKFCHATPRELDVASGFDILRATVVPLWEPLNFHVPGLELVECYGGYELGYDKPLNQRTRCTLSEN